MKMTLITLSKLKIGDWILEYDPSASGSKYVGIGQVIGQDVGGGSNTLIDRREYDCRWFRSTCMFAQYDDGIDHDDLDDPADCQSESVEDRLTMYGAQCTLYKIDGDDALVYIMLDNL